MTKLAYLLTPLLTVSILVPAFSQSEPVLTSDPAEPESTDLPYVPYTPDTFTIYNHGRHIVVSIYISPSDTKDWGPNRVRSNPYQLKPNQHIQFKINCLRQQYYDFAIIYQDFERHTEKHWDVCDNPSYNLDY